MEVDELKPVEDTQLDNIELSEEQEKFFRSGVIHRFKYILTRLKDYMVKKHYTVNDVKVAIDMKKSPFTVSERTFIIMYQTEFLNTLLKEAFPNDFNLSKYIDNMETVNSINDAKDK